MKPPLIIAHRGDMERAPENTLSSFENAIRKGADTIELDVHLSTDNQVVVHHDYYLERTTNGKGFIGNKSLAELKMLDAGSWFDEKFSHERIPTLEEVLDLGKGKIRFEIELKDPDLNLATKVLKLIENYDPNEAVEITSWHTPLLSQVKKIKPVIAIGQFFYPLPEWMEASLGIDHVISLMALANMQVAHIYPDLINSKNVAKLQEAGYKAHASANEQQNKLAHCISSGADQISTNYLDLTLETRSRLSKSGRPDSLSYHP